MITRLQIKDFKSISELDINLDLPEVNISGDNATGKTSIYDAFLWLFTGRDSQNQTDFMVVRSGCQSCTVTADIMGRTISKSLSVKDNGGSTSTYIIDGYPAKKKDFDKFFSDNFPAIDIRCFSDPLFLNSINWKDRRNILLSLSESPVFDEITLADNNLSEISGIVLNGKIDAARDKFKSDLKTAKKKADSIPASINELSAQISDAEKPDAGKLEQLKSKIAELERQQSLSNPNAVKIAELEAELVKIRNSDANTAKIKAEVSAAENKISDLSQKIKIAESAWASNKTEVNRLEKDLLSLRDQWKAVNATEFTSGGDCPTCGQAYPEAKTEELRQAFNLSKSQQLETISNAGKEKKSQMETYASACKKHEDEISKLEYNLEHSTEALPQIKASLEFEADRHVKFVKDESARITGEIAILKKVKSVDNAAEIASLQSESDKIRRQVATFEQSDKIKTRIDELIQQQAAVNQEIESCERRLDMISRYERMTIELVESSINEKFSLIKFRLFEQQVNGNIAEICEAELNVVPYSSLNHAAKIQAGIDCINALQAKYGLELPIWIDNRESVVSIPQTKTSVINLIVRKDSELTIN